MRRDQDLVGGEHREGIGEREQRVGVADDALGDDACVLERVEAGAQALLGGAAGFAVVGRPVGEPPRERRRDDEHLGVAAGGAERDQLAHVAARERLVRDHEQVPGRGIDGLVGDHGDLPSVRFLNARRRSASENLKRTCESP